MLACPEGVFSVPKQLRQDPQRIVCVYFFSFST